MRALVVFAVPLTLAAAALTGCPAATDPCADQVLYTGGGTDEVLATMDDAKAQATKSDQGPTITAPTSGEKLPKADVPTFTWDSPLKIAALSPAAAGVEAEVAHRAWRPSLLDRLSQLVVPSARAHEPPVSSDVYLVEIPLDGEQCPVTVVTTDLSVKLDAASWKRLTAHAGKDLTLSITSAYLQNGRIQEGPYKADPVTFQVAP